MRTLMDFTLIICLGKPKPGRNPAPAGGRGLLRTPKPSCSRICPPGRRRTPQAKRRGCNARAPAGVPPLTAGEPEQGPQGREGGGDQRSLTVQSREPRPGGEGARRTNRARRGLGVRPRAGGPELGHPPGRPASVSPSSPVGGRMQSRAPRRPGGTGHLRGAEERGLAPVPLRTHLRAAGSVPEAPPGPGRARRCRRFAAGSEPAAEEEEMEMEVKLEEEEAPCTDGPGAEATGGPGVCQAVGRSVSQSERRASERRCRCCPSPRPVNFSNVAAAAQPRPANTSGSKGGGRARVEEETFSPGAGARAAARRSVLRRRTRCHGGASCWRRRARDHGTSAMRRNKSKS
uniref:Uncharacterized protein LOC110209656 n=1 Tax=Phascolarctos cinereus TaxID=38626 RepID=A0A6P5KFZ7_PHACI|nr:uncharacterized protein LOC110209656 [Phascolarctos cinereus]